MLVYYPGLNSEIDGQLVGGKAENLALMDKADFNIPKWFAVTAKAFQESLENGEIPNFIPHNIRQEISNTVELLNLKDKFLAVRSSAIGEDGAEHSFAGQLESFLYVKYEDLLEKIKEVWKSTFSERALFYRQSNNLSIDSIKVAVIVQEMINSEVSGVAFGVDPVSGNRNAIMISSVFGQGEGLVSGLLDADTYKIIDNNIYSEIAKKIQYICFNEEDDKYTKILQLPVEKQLSSTLKDVQIKEIANQVNKICKHFGRPQDIEWAIANDKLYILQSRPITTLNKIPDKTGIRVIWDNSNIVESYSGVTTPLTFSFIKDVYTEVYKQFCRIMGVEEKLISQNFNIFQMIGLIKGRVYYNLLNWYKVLALLPGYSINAGFMEQMMGVKEKLEVPPTVIQSSRNKYLRVFNLINMLIINLITLSGEIKKFYVLLNNTLSPYEDIDLIKKKPEELVDIYYNLEGKLLKQWQAPLVNDFYAMIFYGLLKKLINKWNIDDKGTLQNDLLAGDGDIISTEPIRRIRELANQVCKDEVLKSLFLNNEEDKILNELSNYLIYTQIKDYIKKFGNRCIGELKLETFTYKENPIMLIILIKSYAKQGFIDLEKDKQREQLIRKEAKLKVEKELRFNPVKGLLFNFVLKQARLRVKNRENLRFERTRLFGTVREIFLAIGRHFYSEGIIEHSRDIFYLTKEEIFSYINGTATTVNLKSLIKFRKIEFDNYENDRPADRFDTFGIIYQGNSFKSEVKQTSNIDGDLSGIGCCPGVVRAKIKIVKNPCEAKDLEGCIMVAERTDPGWVPLFPISKGILVERGSILSHSAIVAREMGIPAIVGINNLIETLIDGEIVEMDGSKGTIKLFRSENV